MEHDVLVNHGETPNVGKASDGAAPKPITPTPVAVVIDTSLWGKGTLDLGRLTNHAKRLTQSGIEVWIPHQVLLEWASHAVADAKEALPLWKRLARTGLFDGDFPAPSTLNEIEKALTSKVRAIPGVTVLPMTGDAAVAGIKDQILGTGPGETRSGVKTGAVDSSWIRDALAAADNDPSKLLFVTDNAKDVHKAAKAIGVTLHVRSEHHMYSSLFGATAAPNFLIGLITKHITELVALPDYGPDYHGYDGESMVPLGDITLTTAAFDPPYAFEITNATLFAGGSVVAIADVDVVSGPGVQGADEGVKATNGDPDVANAYSHTVELRVLMLGNLEVTGYQLDQDGQVVMQTDGVSDALIVASFVADISDLHVELTAAGHARADLAEVRFDEPHEALEWVLGFLHSLHGVHLENDDITEDEFILSGTDDLTVTAELAGDAHSDWTLTFELGDDTVAISCHYDPNSRVWAGKDSFDMRPPYYVAEGEADAPAAAEPFSALSRVWRYLNGLTV